MERLQITLRLFAQMNITGANASVTYTKADKTLLTRTINISTGAKFVTAGYLYIKGLDKSFASGAAYATITINEGSKILVDDPTTPRVLLDNGEIVFNQANAITTSTGEFVRLASIKDDDTLDDAILRINASQTFRGVHAVGSNIDIYLSTEVAATFDSQEGYATTDGAFIIIHNFQEERIFVGDIFKDGVLTNNANDVFKAFQTIDGNEVQIENLYINNGFLSAAVPEPAEWAAIFGAIALGLAIYRRRK